MRNTWKKTWMLLALAVGLASSGPAWAQGNSGKGGGGGGGGDEPANPPELGIQFEFQYLGALPGGEWSFATAINDDGVVVGRSGTDNLPRGFVWFPETGAMHAFDDLAVPPGDDVWWHIVHATGINDHGQIVGVARLRNVSDNASLTGPGQLGLRLTPNDEGRYDVDVLDGFLEDGGFNVRGIYVSSLRINADGDVTGYHYGEGWRAFVWTEEDGFVDLGQFDGQSSTRPRAIRDRIAVTDVTDVIEIVGGEGDYGASGVPVAWRATYVPGSAALEATDVEFENLGYLYSDNRTDGESRAVGINNFGEIVGLTTTGRKERRAARFTDAGGWENLGTLAPEKSRGPTTSWATALNNPGFIVGMSYIGEPDSFEARAFLYDDDFGMVEIEDLVTNGVPPERFGALRPAAINDWSIICGPTVDNYHNIEGTFAYILTPYSEP
jgi:probable HAF family extracellular repeat protein